MLVLITFVPPMETVPVRLGAANAMLHVVTVPLSPLTTQDWLLPGIPPDTSKSVSP